jgi:hypothetical protein
MQASSFGRRRIACPQLRYSSTTQVDTGAFQNWAEGQRPVSRLIGVCPFEMDFHEGDARMNTATPKLKRGRAR